MFPIKLSPAQEKLHLDFKYCGSRHLEFRQKCIGMLPQIYKEKIYEMLGFASIIEYAAKLAGLSQEQVRLVLNLEKRFEDKPALHSLLVNGEISVNKLARIVSIATIENQEILADKVQLLPARALETLVRDEKLAMAQNIELETQKGSQQPLLVDESLHVQTEATRGTQQFSDIVKLNLDGDVLKELLELQEKDIDINLIIRKMLNERKAEIAEEKEKIAEEVLQKSAVRKQQGKKPSRYIPVKVRNILKAENGTKCSIPGCNKPAKEKHHTQRFALSGTNDPRYMAPLCQEHHIIAQTIDIKYIQVRMAATGHATGRAKDAANVMAAAAKEHAKNMSNVLAPD
jgi:hypothetical protein